MLSVIVPVYNVEKYLGCCIKSIVEQNYRNLELILVDDGSTDNSGSICDDWGKRDSRILVVHKPNGGQSSARNVGLANASGELITYVDSDDWIAPTAYTHCIKLLMDDNADVVQFDYSMAWAENQQQERRVELITRFLDKDILQYYMTIATTATGGYSMCRVICKRKLLDGLLFREGKINEDIDFKYRMLARAKRMIVTNQQYYFYRQGNVTTSSGGLKCKDFDLRDAATELYALAKDEMYGNIRFLAEVKCARTAFSLLCKIAYFGIADPSIEYTKVVKELTKEHRESLPILLKAPLPFSRKICAILLAIHINCLKWPLMILKK